MTKFSLAPIPTLLPIAEIAERLGGSSSTIKPFTSAAAASERLRTAHRPLNVALQPRRRRFSFAGAPPSGAARCSAACLVLGRIALAV